MIIMIRNSATKFSGGRQGIAGAGCALTCALLSSFALNGAEVPRLVLPDGVGVNIHFIRGHEKDLDLIAAAGFKFIRMDFSWTEIERQKGSYDWSAYDELTAHLDQRGIRAYYIIDYSNPLYEETVTSKNPITGKDEASLASPQHPAAIEAFARWAAASAGHFHGRHVIWEIWNEPNIFFWRPKPDVGQYTALALATCKAIRQTDPQATLFAPATSELPWPFLESFFKSGALEFLDGVSVHPYRSPRQPPESAARDLQQLRELIDRYAPAGRKEKIPIISGEWGYSTHTHGVQLETQADFIVRQQLANLLQGIPISIWYDWKNDGEDPNENEHNFGTVTPDLKPKPAYLAIKTLTLELSGYSITRRHDTGTTNDFALVLTNALGETRLAVWTLGEPHDIAFALQPNSGKELSFVNGDGVSGKVEIGNNRFTIPISGRPKYIILGDSRLK
jgi:polysaccharide biosynthesis protein PslG